MCNFWANGCAARPADRAMQVMAAWATRATSRSNTSTATRRYRITEGTARIQKRKVAGIPVGYMGAGEALASLRAKRSNPASFR